MLSTWNPITVMLLAAVACVLLGVVLPGVWSRDERRRTDAQQVLRLLLTRGRRANVRTRRPRRRRRR